VREPERYTLNLQAAPDPGGPSPVLRLRRLLKYAWRVCRLRCTEVREITPAADASRPAEDTRGTEN
jgi:hypothetical protein